MLPRPLLVVLLILNTIVLLGQIWPEGAPPFARTVNIAFLIASMATLAVLLRGHRPAANKATGNRRRTVADPREPASTDSSNALVYEGSIPVADTAYRHTDLVDDVYAEVDIPGLDAVVSRAPSLTFTLDYPFDQPFHGRVTGVQGITLRHIIDAVRDAYRHMYEATSVEDIAHLANKAVTGKYGTAVHVIDDLVIERIVLDHRQNTLAIDIGS